MTPMIPSANTLGPTGAPPVHRNPSWQRYLGEWNQLISSTNWEKGRIICGWRAELVGAGAAPRDYSDEAWAKHVGHVSPQHVGRLRRTFERFGNLYRSYPGLYWSHFYAALDWSDAERWLKECQAKRWSVSQMRNAHWESLGRPAGKEPQETDVVAADYDEDSVDPELDNAESGDAVGRDWDFDARSADADRDDEQPPFDVHDDDDEPAMTLAAAEVARVRPFEQVPELPDDLAEAFEAFKVAIVRHRIAKWQEVARDDVLSALDALKKLVLAPADDR